MFFLISYLHPLWHKLVTSHDSKVIRFGWFCPQYWANNLSCCYLCSFCVPPSIVYLVSLNCLCMWSALCDVHDDPLLCLVWKYQWLHFHHCVLRSSLFKCSWYLMTYSFFPSSFLHSKDFDTTYGPAWHCIVGTSFGSYVTHSLGGFLYFSVDKAYVLLFRTAVQPLVQLQWDLKHVLLELV